MLGRYKDHIQLEEYKESLLHEDAIPSDHPIVRPLENSLILEILAEQQQVKEHNNVPSNVVSAVSPQNGILQAYYRRKENILDKISRLESKKNYYRGAKYITAAGSMGLMGYLLYDVVEIFLKHQKLNSDELSLYNLEMQQTMDAGPVCWTRVPSLKDWNCNEPSFCYYTNCRDVVTQVLHSVFQSTYVYNIDFGSKNSCESFASSLQNIPMDSTKFCGNKIAEACANPSDTPVEAYIMIGVSIMLFVMMLQEFCSRTYSTRFVDFFSKDRPLDASRASYENLLEEEIQSLKTNELNNIDLTYQNYFKRDMFIKGKGSLNSCISTLFNNQASDKQCIQEIFEFADIDVQQDYKNKLNEPIARAP